MSRVKDILLRFMAIFAPVLIPLVGLFTIISILLENIKQTCKDLYYDFLIVNINDFVRISTIKQWFELLYYAFFDWDIGSVNKPRNEAYEKRVKEMKKRDFGESEDE